MRLGTVQRRVLVRVFDLGGRLSRRVLEVWYTGEARSLTRKDRVDTLTKTLERLIKAGLLSAVCVRTAEKWFIKEVRLTPQGRRAAIRLRGAQQRLPLR